MMMLGEGFFRENNEVWSDYFCTEHLLRITIYLHRAALLLSFTRSAFILQSTLRIQHHVDVTVESPFVFTIQL